MSERLATEDRLERPDDLYELLTMAYRDLTPEQSRLLNAKLILLLANHIGDLEVVREAVAIAAEGLANGKATPPTASRGRSAT